MSKPNNILADAIKNKDPYALWALQVLQDSFSMAWKMPLRFVRDDCFERMNESPDVLRPSLKFYFDEFEIGKQCAIKDIEKIKTISLKKEWKRINLEQESDNFSRELFLTEGSYANPAFTLFREAPEWRVMEMCNCLEELQKHKQDKDFEFFFKGKLAPYFISFASYFEAIDSWLILGPCWWWKKAAELKNNTGHEWTEKAIGEYQDCLDNLNKDQDWTESADSEINGEALSIRLNRLKRLGGTRAAINRPDGYARRSSLTQAFNIALNLQLPSYEGASLSEMMKDHSIGVNHFQGLAQVSILLTELGLNDPQKLLKNLDNFWYRTPSLSEVSDKVKVISDNKKTKNNYIFLQKSAASSEGSSGWAIYFPQDCEEPIGKPHDRFLFSDEENSNGNHTLQLTEENIEYLRNLNSKIVDEIHTSRSYAQIERIKLLSMRLTDSGFGMAQPLKDSDASEFNSKPQQNRSGVRIEINEKIARSLVYNLGATICHIYVYDFNSSTLSLVSSFCDGKNINLDAKAIKNYSKMETDSVYYSGMSADRKTSDLYKFFDTNGPKDVDFQPDYEGGDSKILEVAGIPPELFGHSILRVPILIHGRPLGIIELRGVFSRQLRQSTIRWAAEAAREIGACLFSSMLSAYLHQLSRRAELALLGLDFEEKRIEPFICQNMINLFQCEMAMLWEFNEKDNELVCRGSAHSAHLNKSEDKLNFEGKSISRDDTNSLILDAYLKQSNDVKNKFQHSYPDLEDYCKSKNINIHATSNSILGKLKTLQLTSGCIFSITGRSGRSTCMVWLIGRKDYQFEIRWRHHLRSVASQIALALSIADGRDNIFSEKMNQIMHEVDGASTILPNIKTQLESHLEPFANKSLAEKTKMLMLSAYDNIQSHGGFNSKRYVGQQPELEEVFHKILKIIRKETTLSLREKSDHNNVTNLTEQLERLSVLEADYRDIVNDHYLNKSEISYEGPPTDVAYVSKGLRTHKSYEIKILDESNKGSILWLGPRSRLYANMSRNYVALILRNLYENAERYNLGTHAPSVKVTTLIEGGRERSTLTISNLGFYISKEEQERVRNRGNRSKLASMYWPTSGHGLGLNMIIDAAEFGGGSIEGPYWEKLPPKTKIDLSYQVNLEHPAIKDLKIRSKNFNIERDVGVVQTNWIFYGTPRLED